MMCLKGLKCRVVLGTRLDCSCGRRILHKRVRTVAGIGGVASASLIVRHYDGYSTDMPDAGVNLMDGWR